MSLLASGVAVVTVADPGTGRPRGMTANALMSVSLEPPLIVVSVRRQARLHAAVRAAGAYGVTVLSEAQESHARRFAGMPVPGDEAVPAFREHGGVPVLEGGLAWIVTRVTDAHAAGDHTLFVGEITGLGTDRPGDPPLAFHRSVFARLTPVTPGPAIPLLAWQTGLDMWG
jgi:flavin reductase (DIM6/NTAB) family NADH-FMN oxidoreductase RutF